MSKAAPSPTSSSSSSRSSGCLEADYVDYQLLRKFLVDMKEYDRSEWSQYEGRYMLQDLKNAEDVYQEGLDQFVEGLNPGTIEQVLYDNLAEAPEPQAATKPLNNLFLYAQSAYHELLRWQATKDDTDKMAEFIVGRIAARKDLNEEDFKRMIQILTKGWLVVFKFRRFECWRAHNRDKEGKPKEVHKEFLQAHIEAHGKDEDARKMLEAILKHMKFRVSKSSGELADIASELGASA